MISRLTLLLAAAGSSVHGLISGPFAPRRGATSRAAVHMGLAVPLTDFDGARWARRTWISACARGAYVVHRRSLRSRRTCASALRPRRRARGARRRAQAVPAEGDWPRARLDALPLLVGGGVSFGPRPKSYRLKMNRKEKQVAISTALMSAMPRAKLVQDFEEKFAAPRTSGERGRAGGASGERGREEGELAREGGPRAADTRAGGPGGGAAARACVAERRPWPLPQT